MKTRNRLFAGSSSFGWATAFGADLLNPLIASIDPGDDGKPGDGGDGGGGETPEQKAAREAAEKNAGNPAPSDKGPTDGEARLLKDLMKHKKAADDAKKAAEKAEEKLRAFEGIDPAKVREMIAAQEEAERQAAEKRGEYDRLLAQQREAAAAALAAKEKEVEDAKKSARAAERKANDLMVSARFAASRFVNESTVLTGDKARKLYGDHFEIEDGVVVAYDKPRGAANRTPMVDPATGDNLSFEAAIEKIVKADPDFERIGKSSLKPGAGSQGSGHPAPRSETTSKVSGVDLIAKNLPHLQKSAPK